MSLRSLLSAKRPLIGHFVFEFATPGIGYLISNAGADFAVLDLEHSGWSFETAKLIVLSARAADLPLVVRVPSRDAKDLARACDIGADGVMIPMVGSVDDARAAVSAVKYPPEGRRGVGQVQMHDRYRIGPFMDKAAAANASIAVFLQIESCEGVEAAAAIASIPGVDCLWIGHMDLSCSLGAPAQFDTPAFEAATRKVVDAVRAHGRKAGRLVRSVEEAEAAFAAGFHCVGLGTDAQMYQAALGSAITLLRERITR
jgi:2-dehydro-3-deoxyglucarate aldolase/4-hydroxy-2-oxoheptanedioate aldolase